jgi:hypothetical protein
MITHVGARTRALYAWEQDDLEVRIKERLTVEQMQKFANKVWRLEKWDANESVPTIHSYRGKQAYCYGRADIYMPRRQSCRVVVLHELVHARGYGNKGNNQHTVGFVNVYLRVLHTYLGFDYVDLMNTACYKGLI